jgi:hypothetical protein
MEKESPAHVELKQTPSSDEIYLLLVQIASSQTPRSYIVAVAEAVWDV